VPSVWWGFDTMGKGVCTYNAHITYSYSDLLYIPDESFSLRSANSGGGIQRTYTGGPATRESSLVVRTGSNFTAWGEFASRIRSGTSWPYFLMIRQSSLPRG